MTTTALARVTDIGQGADAMKLLISEDAYLGDAAFTVMVDGVAYGGAFTVSTAHASKQDTSLILHGSFGPGAHVVTLALAAPLGTGAAGATRAVYLDGASVDGVATAAAGQVTAAQSFTVQGGPAAINLGSGPDVLELKVSEDAYSGDAAFLVSVDGKLYGGTQTVSATHAGGFEQTYDIRGIFAPGTHSVVVSLSNYLAGSTAATTRDMYVDAATFDGANVAAAALALGATSRQGFTFSAPRPQPATITLGSGTDKLALQMAEDAYLGDAQYTVAVDGVQVGGIQTATASHAAGQNGEVDVLGTFAPGLHTVAVTFLNDAFGGTSTTDRNLYVNGASIDGNAVPGATFALDANGTQAFTFAVAAPAGTGNAANTGTPVTGQVQLVGVNLSGDEFGSALPGVLNVDYIFPTHAEIDYFASKGMDVFRLPVTWERLQPVQGGALDPAQLAFIDDMVAYAATKGMKVDLDIHNAGYGYGNMIGSAGTPNTSFDDLWTRLATHLKGDPNVMFGLMNEPHDQTAAQWSATAQGAVNAIRATGATQEILTPGTAWDGGQNWVGSGNAISMATVTDPAHNMVFEVHQYFDADGGGGTTGVVSPTIGPQRLADVTAWARETGNRLFLGETGAATDPASLAALGNTLTYLAANSDVWQGVTEYGAGPGWGSAPFALDPVGGVDKPQVLLLSAIAPH